MDSEADLTAVPSLKVNIVWQGSLGEDSLANVNSYVSKIDNGFGEDPYPANLAEVDASTIVINTYDLNYATPHLKILHPVVTGVAGMSALCAANGLKMDDPGAMPSSSHKIMQLK